MNDAQFGEIPVEDYLKITGRRRSSWPRRVGAAVLGVVFCVLCTAAGDYFNPFYGDPSAMTYEEAIEVLQSDPPQKFVADTSMFMASRHAQNFLAVLKRVAEENPRDAENASIYLANIAHTVVEYLVDLRNNGVLPERQDHSLEVIRSGTNKDDD